ncbi:hypothetical protein JVT61DRAFT_13420 [Boletus reticuloceps]|uniref:Uncharacterized protein n=1 Tax=Boletus reticuloceps TaxID=495285 RepID=A0A8I3A4H0_9AGAM|nr:hypothetical protein JVT61DRAFT_13420 [Boletus reticuloceps]
MTQRVNNVLTKIRSNDSEQHIQAKLKDIIGQSLRQRLEVLCKEYISTGEYKNIDDTHITVEVLSERMRKIMSGPRHTRDYPPTESWLSRAIRTVLKVLEDLLLNAMEGEDVGEKARRGLLLYQAAPDIILQ